MACNNSYARFVPYNFDRYYTVRFIYFLLVKLTLVILHFDVSIPLMVS